MSKLSAGDALPMGMPDPSDSIERSLAATADVGRGRPQVYLRQQDRSGRRDGRAGGPERMATGRMDVKIHCNRGWHPQRDKAEKIRLHRPLACRAIAAGAELAHQNGSTFK
jgi:hypothetical protein